MKNIKSMKVLASFLAVCMLLSMFAVVSVSADNVLTLKDGSLLSIGESEGTKIVLGFAEQKTVADLLSNFESAESIVASKNDVTLSDSDLVGTGTIITLGEDYACVIISGDTNGDGFVNSTDYMQIKNYFLSSFELDAISFLAADTEADGIIGSTDYMQIKNYFLGTFNLYPEETTPPDVDDSSADDSSTDDSSTDDSSSDDSSAEDSSTGDSSSDDSSVEDSSDDSSIDDSSIDDSSTEDSSDDSSIDDSSDDSSEEVVYDYILNIKNKKIHIPTCSSVAQTSEANKQGYVGTLEDLLAQGYVPCGSCKAGQTEDSSVEDSSDDSSIDDSSIDDSSIEDSSDDSSIDDSSDDSSEEVVYDYILNIKNKKIHIPTCSSVAQTSEANKQGYVGTLEDLLAQGYVPCGNCKAGQTEDSSVEDSSADDSSIEDSSADDSSIEDSSDDSSVEDPYTVVDTPAVDTAYKFALTQANLGKALYFAGAKSGNYLATTEDSAAATDVYFEEVEGGYRIYFMDGETKMYIDIYEYATGKVGVQITSEPTAIFTYNEEAGVFVANVIGNDYYLGTYNSFNTISASKISYITGSNASKVGVSQFPAYVVTLN